MTLLSLVTATMLVTQAGTGVRTECKVKGEATLIASTRELLQENRLADACNLSNIKDKANLRWYIEQGYLVPMRDGDDEPYEIDPYLAEADPDDPELYLYVRPWTKQFIETTAARMWTEIGLRMRITSLVRPESYQAELRTFNRNAARDSTHPTGATVDISMVDYTWRQKNWLRKTLLALERDGLVEATEERGNACMHVFVHPAYGVEEAVETEGQVPAAPKDEDVSAGDMATLPARDVPVIDPSEVRK